MKSYKQLMNEKIECELDDTPITASDLKAIERVLDNLFASLNVDIEFTRHFLDRLNDKRNGKQITTCELLAVYKAVYQKFGVEISDEDDAVEKLIRSISTGINIPVAIKWNKKKKEVEVVAKTIMRKRNFKTRDKQMKVEGVAYKWLVTLNIHDSKELQSIVSEVESDKNNDLVSITNNQLVYRTTKSSRQLTKYNDDLATAYMIPNIKTKRH